MLIPDHRISRRTSDIVMPLCGPGHRLLSSQNQTLRREIMLHAQRLPHPNGWSICTEQHTLLFVGYRDLQSWQSGLGRTCMKSWDFQINPIRDRSLAPAGLLPSSTVSCMSMLCLVN